MPNNVCRVVGKKGIEQARESEETGGIDESSVNSVSECSSVKCDDKRKESMWAITCSMGKT